MFGQYVTATCESKRQSGGRQNADGTLSTTDLNPQLIQYMWACQPAYTTFCCHDSNTDLYQFDCCNDGAVTLASTPIDLNATIAQSLTLTSSMPSTTVTATNSNMPPTSSALSAAAMSATSPGLATGAKTGIGIGALAAILAMTGAFVFWRTHNNKKRSKDLHVFRDGKSWASEPRYDNVSAQQYAQAPSTPLETDGQRYELPAPQVVSEMAEM